MQSSVRLLCVNPEQIRAIWPLARPLIKRAIERTGLSDFAYLELDVVSGDQLLWLASDGETIEAAATTRLIMVCGRKICLLTACGGRNRKRWLPLLEDIEVYAKREGCAAMRISGRKGWKRVLGGYLARYVILEKELS